MNLQEQYKLACTTLIPEVTAQEVRCRAEQTKVTHRHKAYLPVLAAAVAVLLLVSAAAAGVAGGWLAALIPNAESVSEFDEATLTPQSTVTLNEVEYTVDNLLAEGNTVFLRVTTKAAPGRNAGELPWSRIRFALSDKDDDFYSGFNATARRLDDGSDPSVHIGLYFFALDYPPTVCAGKQARLLLIDPQTGEETHCLAEFTIPPTDRRSVTLSDGSTAELGSYSLQIYGDTYYGGLLSEKTGVMLKDGTFVAFSTTGGSGTAVTAGTGEPSPEDGNVFNGLYERAVDPKEISAIVLDDTVLTVEP